MEKYILFTDYGHCTSSFSDLKFDLLSTCTKRKFCVDFETCLIEEKDLSVMELFNEMNIFKVIRTMSI